MISVGCMSHFVAVATIRKPMPHSTSLLLNPISMKPFMLLSSPLASENLMLDGWPPHKTVRARMLVSKFSMGTPARLDSSTFSKPPVIPKILKLDMHQIVASYDDATKERMKGIIAMKAASPKKRAMAVKRTEISKKKTTSYGYGYYVNLCLAAAAAPKPSSCNSTVTVAKPSRKSQK